MEPVPRATLDGPTFTAARDVPQTVSLTLQSSAAAAGVQVDLVFDPAVIPLVNGIASTGRAAALVNAVVQNVQPGRARLLLFDPSGGAGIPAGAGPVVAVSFQVSPGAPSGASPVNLERGLVVDENGRSFDVTLVPGQATVTP